MHLSMKTGRITSLLALVLLLAGCFVASFYPLYTDADLHPDTLMAGAWLDKDSTLWNFEYITLRESDKPMVTDSTGYYLTFQENGEERGKSSLEIRVVRLGGIFFLDFFINDIKSEDFPDFFMLHTIPIHTFAMVTRQGDSITLTWLGEEWVKEQARQKKLEISHLERNDEVLLTARTPDLQKFMVKCAAIPEAWEKGTTIVLHR